MANIYTAQQKAEAVARVLAGARVGDVARDMAITRSAISNWLANVKSPPVKAVDLVMTDTGNVNLKSYLHTYLAEVLLTLTDHARLYRDSAWTAGQTTETIMAVDRQLSSRFVSIMDRLDGRSRETAVDDTGTDAGDH